MGFLPDRESTPRQHQDENLQVPNYDYEYYGGYGDYAATKEFTFWLTQVFITI